MTVKELEAAFTAAAENTMQKAEALGLVLPRCVPSVKSTARLPV